VQGVGWLVPHTLPLLLQTHEGLPLVKPGGEHETKQVHVFAKQFALQAPDYEAVTGFSSSASR
jgi:hypothetical protein